MQERLEFSAADKNRQSKNGVALGKNGAAQDKSGIVQGRNKGIFGTSKEPTLEDVFDKKTYYNPGKIRSRLVKQLEKFEAQLAESEEKAATLQLQLMDPALASDYQKLMEVQTRLQEEEHMQETLLERMLEAEKELESLEFSGCNPPIV